MSRVAARFGLAGVVCVLSLAACDNPTRHKAQAENALNELHAKINDAQYHAIYAAADPGLRQAVSEPEVASLLQSIRERLGPSKSSILRKYMSIVNVNGFTIFVSYDTTFNKGNGTERVIWRSHGDTLLLLDYQISSDSLAGALKSEP